MSARRDRAASGAFPRNRFTDRSGFTLIEVMVAFTVLAMLLSVMYRAVVDMRAGSNVYDNRTAGEIVARGVLADALANRQAVAGTTSGLRDGHRWSVVATPIDLSASLPPPPPPKDDGAPAGASGQAGAPPPAPPKTAPKIVWVPQRLVVGVETGGRPVSVEAIRLVKAPPGSQPPQDPLR